ncbi:MAG: rhamnogalacturonan lyase [Duncaniella sp.]|nr:rhamnogalacturonan lyase [Duncaniella sp.]
MKKILMFALLFVSLIAVAQGKYDMTKLQREKLGRGVVAVRESPEKVAVSWRYLSSDPKNIAFNVYRDGKKINKKPITGATFYTDTYTGTAPVTYTVRAAGKAANVPDGYFRLAENAPVGYLPIPIERPADEVDEFGKEYTYSANDASIGDVDGDGEYEIFLKWDPSNAHDNAHNGLTGNVLIDCYKLDGTRLWRIDLGHNIRAGAHYTQFMVYDLDGDGCAELVCKTADGTVDGTGRLIGSRKADWRNLKGRIVSGPEYLTVFNGRTGEAMQTIDYIPERGNLQDWGDSYANRSDRFLACVAYLDGVRPSVVMCRGYYTRSVLAAFDWDGKNLTNRWTFDSDNPGCGDYAGQGNHNLRVADVDGDGCDEIIYGQMVVNNDGTGLHSTGMGHGDALHLISDIKNEKYYIWGCHENRRDGTTLREAATGKVILQYPSDKDIGRCMSADIDPRYPGNELWSPNTGGILSFAGEVIQPFGFSGEAKCTVPVNMAVWWDGDLLRELLDGNEITKYNWETGKLDKLLVMEGAVSNNWSKANPCLQGDIIGDWREEVLMRTPDSSELRLYVTTIPTERRFYPFVEDIPYRLSVAAQNVAYNQPTQPGFYFGPDME